MKENFIREKQLQDWFEVAVAENRLGAAIRNRPELKQRMEAQNASWRVTENVQREGLARAERICRVLDEPGHLSTNNSVALAGYSQMRPDLVLFSESANYVLVELKTRPEPERQGVQELLAYSAAIKMNLPYVNDFLYVIVAGAWDTLLSFGVRALIMDGKSVLPLQWTLMPNGEFALDVRLDLFDFNFVQPYDPFFAMSTSTFAVTRPTTSTSGAFGYLCAVAGRAVLDCRRMQQSGFIITWSNPEYGYHSEILSTTLATVNQHWLQSEYLPSEFVPPPVGRPSGIAGLLHRKSQVAYRARTMGAKADDFWAQANAYQAAARLYPQSSLSYEVLERERNIGYEKELKSRQPLLGHFEQGGDCNLSYFLKTLLALDEVRVWQFIPFGELEDFARQTRRLRAHILEDVVALLTLFREHKGYGPPMPAPSKFTNAH